MRGPHLLRRKWFVMEDKGREEAERTSNIPFECIRCAFDVHSQPSPFVLLLCELEGSAACPLHTSIALKRK